jgi:hypothetical protein
VTAVVAVAKYGPVHHHKSSKKAAKEKLIRVLLDSGSDGDLLFHEKGRPKHFPYLTRQVPCSWHTSNGVFQTKGRGNLPIKFFEYSSSKEILAEPDVFEYDKKMGKSAFDLILGCNSMERLGIVMDFKTKMITINEIILPMRNIESLTKSKVEEAWAVSNALSHEPISTEQATQRAKKILDAMLRKAPRTAPESAARASARVLVPRTFESLKRRESRKAAHSARNMGACTQLTIPVSAVSTKRTELYKRVLVRKQPLDRNVTAAARKNRAIPSRRLWNASRNSRKWSKRATEAPKRRNVATKVVTLVIPTPNRIVGTVVL